MFEGRESMSRGGENGEALRKYGAGEIRELGLYIVR